MLINSVPKRELIKLRIEFRLDPGEIPKEGRYSIQKHLAKNQADIRRKPKVLSYTTDHSVKTNESVDDDDKGIDHGARAVGVPLLATHWVSASATGSGNGTQENPYTLAQALQLAQPGWRVSCGPGDLGRLQQASPARNAAVDLLNLNGGGTSATCHMGAYSNDNVVIGIRPVI